MTDQPWLNCYKFMDAREMFAIQRGIATSLFLLKKDGKEVSNMELAKVLEKAEKEERLSEEEVLYLLKQQTEENVQQIFQTARKIRNNHFENQVFAYGFVYFSTFCKNNCTFCYYRENNQKPPRYRKTKKEIVETAVQLKESGVHLIDLTMGEDPYFTVHKEELVDIVSSVKQATGLPIMISPGVISDQMIDQLQDAGADWYALYQETHNRELYNKMRLKQDYDVRMHAKEYAKKQGMLIEEGLLAGIGDTKRDALDSFEEMKRLGASQVRTMTFVPQDGTPMEKTPQNSFLSELLNIAVMRILFPDKLIPASLDVDGLAGLKDRLQAGANVITSIIPPQEGFLGVANAETDIDQGYRTIEGIQETLKECGLNLASAEEYKQWVAKEKERGEAVESCSDWRETTRCGSYVPC